MTESPVMPEKGRGEAAGGKGIIAKDTEVLRIIRRGIWIILRPVFSCIGLVNR